MGTPRQASAEGGRQGSFYPYLGIVQLKHITEAMRNFDELDTDKGGNITYQVDASSRSPSFPLLPVVAVPSSQAASEWFNRRLVLFYSSTVRESGSGGLRERQTTAERDDEIQALCQDHQGRHGP